MKVLLFCLILIVSSGFSSILFASSETEVEAVNVEDLDNFSKAVDAVRDKDYALAADLFHPLAEAGDIDAQFNLSILIRNGLGRPQNFSKALFWAWLSFSGGLEKAKAVVEVIIELVPESAHDAIRLQVFDFLLSKGFKQLEEHERVLRNELETMLATISGLKVFGTAEHKLALASFTLEGVHSHDVGTVMDQDHVAIRVGHHCAQPLMTFFGVPATARISIGCYNTKEDLQRCQVSLEKVVDYFK